MRAFNAVRAHLTAVTLLLTSQAFAADVAGAARLWVGGGVDTNPSRNFTSPGVSSPADGVVEGIANLEGQVQGERTRALGLYDLGGRKFFLMPSEDTLVQSLYLDGSVYVGRGVAPGLTLRGRDRRGAERDYSDLVAEAYVSYQPDASVDVRLRGGAHRFLYWDRFDASYGAGEGGLTVRYRINKRHSFTLAGDLSLRQYNGLTYRDPADPSPPPPVQRQDTFWMAGGGYTYRGTVNLTLSYGYADNSSNSYGESYRQHRIGLLFGVALPWRLMFLLNANLRLMLYDQGINLSPDLLVLEDGENQSSVSAKLVRPLSEHFDLDLRYAVYFARLPNNDLTYLRQVASLGVAMHF